MHAHKICCRLPRSTLHTHVLSICLLALAVSPFCGARGAAAGSVAPAQLPGVHLQPQAAVALQESAPAGQPWTPLLLSAGALPVLAPTQASAASSNAASAPALSPSLRSNRPGEHTEDVVDYGSQGSDPNTTPATAAVPPLTTGSPGGTRERMGLTVERIEEGSQGTDPNPVPAPGTAAAREDGHNATGEVIVGVDDRKRVLATTTYPWRAVGSLTGDDGKVGLECTAALIAPSFLLTAAHCVYVPGSGYLNNLRFTAGRDDDRKPYGGTKGVRAAVPDAYKRLADADTTNSEYGNRRPYDWAVIKLDSAVGDGLGYFGRYRDYDSSDFTMNTAGYPFDKGNEMWFSACDHQHMSPSEGAVFPYTCDTQPGNSGGPVWVNMDGKRYYIGIHTGSDPSLQMNYGTRYSSVVHAFVENAMSTL